jgi:hypothetical protein
MKIQIVSPKPYFNVAMECSNRAFYELKDKILEIVGTLTNY